MFMVGVVSITDVNPIKARHGVLIKTLKETKKAKTTKAAGGSQHAH
jgi:hypothetical protein